MERRFFQTEIRADGDQGSDSQEPKLNGYAAVFDQLSVVLYGLFRERIERGAFAGTLSDDVRALWNHNPDYVLGRTTAGTLSLAEDSHGLRVQIDPPNTQAGHDAVESIRRGDVDQMSFMFDVLEDTWDKDEEGQVIRTLRKVKLYEVSPVAFPAYLGTEISARADNGPFGDMPTIPEQLRRAADGDGAERAQARLAVMRRQLDLMSIE